MELGSTFMVEITVEMTCNLEVVAFDTPTLATLIFVEPIKSAGFIMVKVIKDVQFATTKAIEVTILAFLLIYLLLSTIQ